MKARADLLHVAEALATRARSHVAMSPAPDRAIEEAARCAQGAKAALEAAALVDAEPAPIVAALERLTVRLGLVDVDAILNVSGPAEAIEATADVLEHMQREVAIGAAVQHGYIALRELAQGLERDFSASETDTAQRIAARIHQGLEVAEQAIEAAKQPEGQS